MTPEHLREIRERDASFSAFSNQAETDRRALLAHLDAITAAVRAEQAGIGTIARDSRGSYDPAVRMRNAILAILQGRDPA